MMLLNSCFHIGSWLELEDMSPALLPHGQEFLKQQALVKGQNAFYKGLTSWPLLYQQRDYSMDLNNKVITLYI